MTSVANVRETPYLMSAHVIGEPSWKVTPSRSVKVQVLPPSRGRADVGRQVRRRATCPRSRPASTCTPSSDAVDRGREERQVLAGVGALRVDLVPLLGLRSGAVDRAAVCRAGGRGPRSPRRGRRAGGPPGAGAALAVGALVAAEPPQAATRQRGDDAEGQGARTTSCLI